MRNATLLSLALLPILALHAQAPAPTKGEIIVKRAIAYAKANGLDKLILQTNQANGVFHVGSGSELYLYVYDMSGVVVAHGYRADLVGKSRIDVKDPDGKYYVQAFIQMAKSGKSGLVDYKFPNPLDGKVEPKTAYVEAFENHIFCCGTYRK